MINLFSKCILFIYRKNLDCGVFLNKFYFKATDVAIKEEELKNCNFIQCDFTGTLFNASIYIESTFTNCNFSGANLFVTKFEECKMTGSDFEEANLDGLTIVAGD